MSPADPLPDGREAAGSQPSDRLQQILLQLWATHSATIAERLDIIAAAHRRLRDGTMDEETRLRARDAAHKLAGVLGTFGLPEGTSLARGIEAVFEHPQEQAAPEPARESEIAEALESLRRMIAAKSGTARR